MADSSSVLVIVSYSKLGLCGGVEPNPARSTPVRGLVLACWRGWVGKASSSWWLGELLSLIVERLYIQGAWTEQRFSLSSFEVSGVWSYRLAGEAAAISVVWVQKWRISGGGL
ncbi:hypothetical protein IGI04_018917 [Brassica rapa subsp. trilocularis]|uniref:Uncharacterized protein n=1 Tax=Brassica rapa subsp. trilocularis TaxID=1813537 RepID=A0ABQ7MED1_BRACM|nr:hypothetical protein IGI04_018917 [Brassica rapa subsp. trilocularis]